MNWRFKARIQNVIASLPFSDHIYFAVQRNAGSLKPGKVTPLDWFGAVARYADWLRSLGRSFADARILEVGTGRTLGAPTAFWLLGAREVVTVDLNKYLSSALVEECTRYVAQHPDPVREIFGEYSKSPIFVERMEKLLAFKGNLDEYLRLISAKYKASADATSLDYKDGSFDYHFSYAVLEHVPPEVIRKLVREAKRLLAPGGLFIHTIDPSDHFSHDDPSINAVNFLQFSDREWGRLAGNKYMYQNRLRAYEYLQMFNEESMEVVAKKLKTDPASLSALKNGMQVDARYKQLAPEELAITSLNVIGAFPS